MLIGVAAVPVPRAETTCHGVRFGEVPKAFVLSDDAMRSGDAWSIRPAGLRSIVLSEGSGGRRRERVVDLSAATFEAWQRCLMGYQGFGVDSRRYPADAEVVAVGEGDKVYQQTHWRRTLTPLQIEPLVCLANTLWAGDRQGAPLRRGADGCLLPGDGPPFAPPLHQTFALQLRDGAVVKRFDRGVGYPGPIDQLLAILLDPSW